jgi:hypothetical protein
VRVTSLHIHILKDTRPGRLLRLTYRVSLLNQSAELNRPEYFSYSLRDRDRYFRICLYLQDLQDLQDLRELHSSPGPRPRPLGPMGRVNLEHKKVTNYLCRYREKLRVHALRVMSVVEKTMHRLDSHQRCLRMLKVYGKRHQR